MQFIKCFTIKIKNRKKNHYSFYFAMARTKQTAKKSNGGKKPRKNTKKQDHPEQAKKSPRSAIDLPIVIQKNNPKRDQTAYEHVIGQTQARRQIHIKSPTKFIDMAGIEPVKDNVEGRAEVIWNLDYDRMANILGIRFKRTFKVLFTENTKTLYLAATPDVIELRRKMTRFVCKRYKYLDIKIKAKEYKLVWLKMAQLIEKEKELDSIPVNKVLQKKYTDHRRKHYE